MPLPIPLPFPFLPGLGLPRRKSPSSVGSGFFPPVFVGTGAVFGVLTFGEVFFFAGVEWGLRLTAEVRRGVAGDRVFAVGEGLGFVGIFSSSSGRGMA